MQGMSRPSGDICFAQERVEGILMWGFWEGANWIPASSL